MNEARVRLLSHVLMLVLTQLVCGRPKESGMDGTSNMHKEETLVGDPSGWLSYERTLMKFLLEKVTFFFNSVFSVAP
jgi:hypothetical protein